ncbi:hypothetical protein KIN20_017873 [Parelaphostrongylus tenuis]|uniref:Uncharacterized protein n=1 Tax=Parelaphostrongylus tenuis TaxID=148309 RepID=A0AAD5N6T5_PARTN|nr:hypothetical protein KIN20_017873 [Parelaphostrongylus tenuis]
MEGLERYEEATRICSRCYRGSSVLIHVGCQICIWCAWHISPDIHAAEYLQQYTSESLVVSSSTADPEMAEKLNRRQGILRPTPHALKKAYLPKRQPQAIEKTHRPERRAIDWERYQPREALNKD